MNQTLALKQLKLLDKYGKRMRLAAEKWVNEFQTLISIILSARTRDETTIKVAKELFKKYPTAKKLSKANIKEIEKIIKPVNFYKNKSKNILNCSKILIKEYNSEIPESIDELIKLSGVGRKTANVFLAEKGKNAIGVDTHLNYVSRKLGWSNHVDPHKIEIDLEKLFHKNYWRKINPIAVRFGKTYTSRKEKDKILEEIKCNP
ncbi:endonuclease III [Candidatus Pacearchaeota archaeon]|nr:endonuclease III [Candidatus Pacearchaeota archaeon]MBI2057272.1 endonuclease III [Candidatus Pacearchaeota archaeon]